MTTEAEIEVYRALRESQNKYVYFLLAAAGAGIALAVDQTKSASIAWSQAPLAVAVLLWGMSFYCGCRHLVYVSATLIANAKLLSVQSGQSPEIGQHLGYAAAVCNGIRKAAEHNSDMGNRFWHWQFRFLVIGAVFYLAWHILEMYLRSIRFVV